MHGTKPVRPMSHPCLTAELLDTMAATKTVSGFPAAGDTLPGPLSQREMLLFHFVIFLIGSWNLLIINFANSPGHLWFWPWVAAWAGALGLHLVIVLLLSCRCRREGVGPLSAGRGAVKGGVEHV